VALVSLAMMEYVQEAIQVLVLMETMGNVQVEIMVYVLMEIMVYVLMETMVHALMETMDLVHKVTTVFALIVMKIHVFQ